MGLSSSSDRILFLFYFYLFIWSLDSGASFNHRFCRRRLFVRIVKRISLGEQRMTMGEISTEIHRRFNNERKVHNCVHAQTTDADSVRFNATERHDFWVPTEHHRVEQGYMHHNNKINGMRSTILARIAVINSGCERRPLPMRDFVRYMTRTMSNSFFT